jgi:HPt (histidine-containing phosphotransfer) domain-containing protein
MDMDLPPDARAKYLSRREKDLSDCRLALQNADYEVPIRIGHQLKGNATTFGFEPLAEIGHRLETAGKLKNPAQIEAALADFTTYLKSQISSQ